MTIQHLHLHVKERSTSEQFYERWLDMRIARQGESITFMSGDNGFNLALMDDPAPAPMPGWFHFGTKLETADAVARLHDRMRAANVPIAKELYRDEELASFRCRDPDGYAIEIYWEP